MEVLEEQHLYEIIMHLYQLKTTLWVLKAMNLKKCLKALMLSWRRLRDGS